MDEYGSFGVDFAGTGTPYGSQWELLRDLFAVLDYRIYLLYKYHQWLGPDNDMKNMLGLVVTREEFEHNLSKASLAGLEERATADEFDRVSYGERAVELRLEHTEADGLPLLQLWERFGLDSFEKSCVLLACAAELDNKYEKLFAYLQDDITKKRPSATLAASLFMPAGAAAEEYMARFSRETAFTSLFDREQLGGGLLQLLPQVMGFLSGGVSLPGGCTLFDGGKDAPAGELLIQQDMAERLDALFSAREDSFILISGAAGSGKRLQVEQLCVRHGVRCLFADLSVLGQEPAAVHTAVMLARMTGAYLCFRGVDGQEGDGSLTAPPSALAEALAEADIVCGKLFLLSELPLHIDLSAPAPELELPPVTPSERLELFRAFLKDVPLEADVSAEELSSKFHFTPRQIRLACDQAAGLARINGVSVTSAELHRCCYRQVVHKLGALAKRVRPSYKWDDVVLPVGQKRLMQGACDRVRWQHRVYYDWGFDKKIGYGRGVSLLFAGVPGTGKTMCAQVIAAQLNMEMYKINISQIVSKYIGETEKNLQAVFNEAKSSNCILFFDECDALFGKRSEVKDAHDRNANVETAYLLQQIEEYDGVCILATNLIQNIDEAFMRRITYVVHFPFPDEKMRREIYLRTLPADAPTDDGIDWDFLAEKFEVSGGYIKNIVLAAAFMAAGEGKVIGMRQLLNAAINELKKNEIVVVREQLREYADLIE